MLEEYDRAVAKKVYDDGEVRVSAVFVHTKQKLYNIYLILLPKVDCHTKASHLDGILGKGR